MYKIIYLYYKIFMLKLFNLKLNKSNGYNLKLFIKIKEIYND